MKHSLLLFTGLLLLSACTELPPPANDITDNDEVFCTMDAKLCPDGSYVGRIPPNCEFAPCPGETQEPEAILREESQDPAQAFPMPIACADDAKICPDGSFVGRVAPDCAFAPCPGEIQDTGEEWSNDDTQDGDSPTPVFCTMDAKLCPDGSYVGRMPPNCEFAPCPGDTLTAPLP